MKPQNGCEKISGYLKQIRHVVDGGSWVDESFAGKLGGVDGTKAFLQPVPGRHSVAEILWHCIYWRTVLIKRIEGDSGYRDRTVDALNFLPLEELRKKGWERLKSEFHEGQEKIIALLELKNDAFLDGEYQKGFTFEYIVEGLIQHDMYHLGQIGFVLAILNDKR